jgi:hypothetical protein
MGSMKKAAARSAGEASARMEPTRATKREIHQTRKEQVNVP